MAASNCSQLIPPSAFFCLIESDRFDGLTVETLERVLATCDWYGMQAPRALLRQRAAADQHSPPRPMPPADGGVAEEEKQDQRTPEPAAPIEDLCTAPGCLHASTRTCCSCDAKICDEHMATCMSCHARFCYECAFTGHACINGEWVANLEFTAAKIALAETGASPRKQARAEAEQEGSAPAAEPFGRAPVTPAQTRDLEDLFGNGPSFEFTDLLTEDNELFWGVVPSPSLYWKSHRANLANARVETPRVFDGWLPPEDAQIIATSAGAERTAAGLVLASWMREAGEDISDFKNMSVASSAWALIRPSVVWIILPENLKEKGEQNERHLPAPCRLASLLPMEPSAGEEGFTFVDNEGTIASSEGACMGWHNIQHRRPGTWNREQPSSETVDGSAEPRVEATHVAVHREPLDVSADELEGWVSVCYNGE